jgi:hypothetical protein
MIETAIHCVSAYDDICWTLYFDSLGTQCPAVFMQCPAVFLLSGETAIHRVSAYDRDGDSLRLGVCMVAIAPEDTKKRGRLTGWPLHYLIPQPK